MYYMDSKTALTISMGTISHTYIWNINVVYIYSGETITLVVHKV